MIRLGGLKMQESEAVEVQLSPKFEESYERALSLLRELNQYLMEKNESIKP